MNIMKLKRDHLVIYDNTNSYTFWIRSGNGLAYPVDLGELGIRGTETKERFEDVQDLVDHLKTCHQTIETVEII